MNIIRANKTKSLGNKPISQEKNQKDLDEILTILGRNKDNPFDELSDLENYTLREADLVNLEDRAYVALKIVSHLTKMKKKKDDLKAIHLLSIARKIVENSASQAFIERTRELLSQVLVSTDVSETLKQSHSQKTKSFENLEITHSECI
jgi:hypothetical protein